MRAGGNFAAAAALFFAGICGIGVIAAVIDIVSLEGYAKKKATISLRALAALKRLLRLRLCRIVLTFSASALALRRLPELLAACVAAHDRAGGFLPSTKRRKQ